MDQIAVFGLLYGLAVLAGVISRRFRLPEILGYVLVGVLINSLGLIRGDVSLLRQLGGVGVTLLLFLIGLEMKVGDLGKGGVRLVIITILQLVGFSSLLYFVIGYGSSKGLMLTVPLIFSSTILCVKWLEERKDINSVLGRSLVGILLVQDIMAVLFIIFLKGGQDFGLVILKTILTATLIVVVGGYLMSRVHKFIKLSSDEVVMVGLGWCLVMSIFASRVMGLSMEIGGFLSGLGLSSWLEREHISIKLRFLKDFFLTVFFINLGISFDLSRELLFTGSFVGFAVVIIKPIVSYIFLRLFGFGQRVSYLMGIGLGQVSEFGLILSALMVMSGVLTRESAGVISVAALFSMIWSALVGKNADSMYRWLKPILNRIWSDSNGPREGVEMALEDHIVLIGCHRMGRSLLASMKRDEKARLLVVDFDLEVVNRLRERGIRAEYADLGDPDSYERLNLKEAAIIISTVKDLEDNLQLLSEVKRLRLKAPIVVDAETIEDVNVLYSKGADYVVFPNYVGGLHLSEMLVKWLKNQTHLVKNKNRQRRFMEGVYKIG